MFVTAKFMFEKKQKNFSPFFHQTVVWLENSLTFWGITGKQKKLTYILRNHWKAEKWRMTHHKTMAWMFCGDLCTKINLIKKCIVFKINKAVLSHMSKWVDRCLHSRSLDTQLRQMLGIRPVCMCVHTDHSLLIWSNWFMRTRLISLTHTSLTSIVGAWMITTSSRPFDHSSNLRLSPLSFSVSPTWDSCT